MPGRTLESEDWVTMQRDSLRELGNKHPEQLLPDGDPLRAIAFDYLQTQYAGNGSVPEVTPEIASSWLETQGFDYEEALKHSQTLADLCNELYLDDAFREAVFQPLYMYNR